MKVVFKLMIFFLLVACNKKTEENLPEYETQEELNKRITEGKSFFDFDEVVHYQIEISEHDYRDLIKKDTVSRHTKMLTFFLERESPTTNEDKIDFQEAINSEGAVKKVIDSKYYEELRTKVFAERKCDQITATACVPIYRDIFVFSNNKVETGIAKICFGCDQVSFSKGDFICDCFGMNDELGRLKKIIFRK